MNTRPEAVAEASSGAVTCAACGRPLTRGPRVRVAQGKLTTCDQCGVWTYWPRPTATGQAALHDSAEYFEHPYFELRRRATPQLDRRCRELFERLRAAGVDITSLKARRVLDVGCDTGAFLLSAARQYDVIPVGVDVAARAVRIAQDSGIEAHQARIEDAPSQLRNFPLITAIDLIEHVTNPLAFLNSIRERLTPGGVAYLETPNIGSVIYRIGCLLCRLTRGRPAATFERLFPPQHIQYFTLKSFAKLVRASGLEIVELDARVLPARDVAASLLVRLGMEALQVVDRMSSNGILIYAVVRRPLHGGSI